MAKPYANQPNNKPIFNAFITPIGLFCHMYHDKPSMKTKDQHGQVPDIDPETGLQNAEWKVTMAWKKQANGQPAAELAELIALANKTVGEGWPESQQPGAFFALEPFFRDGDNPAHNTKNREYLRGCHYLNFKQRATITKDPQTGKAVYGGQPGLLGPYGPTDKIFATDVWAGCTGRVSGVMFCTDYMGKNFISVRLNNIQKYEEGDRIGGGERPKAEDQFDALKTGQPGLGLGSAGPLGGLGAPGGGLTGLTGLGAPNVPSGGFLGGPTPNRIL